MKTEKMVDMVSKKINSRKIDIEIYERKCESDCCVFQQNCNENRIGMFRIAEMTEVNMVKLVTR